MGGKKGKNNPKEPKETLDASKYVDLNKFWIISQDENQDVPIKTKHLALTSLIEILQKYYREAKNFVNLPTKFEFMNLALTNIVKQNSMYISVNFLKNLILTFPRDSVMEGRNYNNRNQD